MKILTALVAATAILAALPTTVQAETEVGQWYVSPMISYIVDDEDRPVDEKFSGYHLGLGKAFHEKWDFEINAILTTFSGRPDIEQWGLGFDFHHVFNRAGRLSPYLLAGIGYIDTDLNPGGQSNAMASYGVGVDIDLFEGVPANLRGEARVRSDFAESQNLQDVLYSIGFSVPFGMASAPMDSDGDGVPDETDRCPGTPAGAVVDARGCEIDSDGDGVVDSKDQCPDTRRGARVDANGCEIFGDSDGDGVTDNVDQCPNTPRGAKVDARGCELDSDGDGVVDSKDRCPGTAAGVRVDVNGCEIKGKIDLPGVQFELNSANLKADTTAILDTAAATLRLNSDLKVEVAGHTDSQGAESYNQTLSQQRADAVRQYLISNGASADMLTARGYGEAQPVADNGTREGRAQNRRVELRILNQ